MDEQPLVTIVTPSYNQGQFIAETIESVLAQTYPQLEYIIIDGGSTDDTLAVIRRYESDPRLIWVSEPDRGMGHALNKGFDRSKGAIMGWLNSDDVLIGQPVAETVAFFSAHPDVAVVYGDAIYTDADGKPTGKLQLGRPFDFIRTLAYLNCVPQPGTFWRRSLWEKIGPLREDFHLMLDAEYWLRASRAGKLQYCPGVRGTYRLHEASKSTLYEIKSLEEHRLLIDEMYADPTHYPEAAANRQLIESDLALQFAKAYWRQGEKSPSRHYASRALRQSPLRRRWPAILAFYLDTHLGTNLAGGLSNGWRFFKSLAGGKNYE